MKNYPKFRVWDNVHTEESNKFWYSHNLPDDLKYWEFWKWIEQHPDIPEENLQPYIGLQDKTGRDIYVGDIIQLNGRDVFDPLKERYGIKWDKLNAGFTFINLIKGHGEFTNDQNWYNSYTIIGNIFENPELMEQVK